MIPTWPSDPPPSVVEMVAALVLSSSFKVLIVSYVGVHTIFVSVGMGKASISLSIVLIVAVVGCACGSSCGC